MQVLLRLQRTAYFLKSKKVPVLPKLIYYFQFFLFNSSVPSTVKIGKTTKFAYGGIGVVIHERSVIGENCVIGQGVTIGGRSKHYEVPVIGNNVYIGAGARILGPVEIGDEVVIGPNSVVIDNIPSNSIAVGMPAKVIKSNIMVKDYV
jgi:serine O-acetyltransferase